MCARCQREECQAFWSYGIRPCPSSIFSLSLPSFVTVYSDCLQARRHFPVKVSLMNSNDLTDCLRQVIHNHSSSPFSPSPLPAPTVLSYLLTLFLSLKKNQKKRKKKETTFPGCRQNVLTVAFFFSSLVKFIFLSFFCILIGHVAFQNPFPSTILLLCHEDGCSHSLL